MRRLLIASSLPLLGFSLASAPTLTAQQNPLPGVLDKIQKKIDCTVGGKNCPDQGKRPDPKAPAPEARSADSLDATVTERRIAPMTRSDYMPAAGAGAITRPSDVLRIGLPPWAVVSDDWEHAAGIAPKPTGVAVVVDGREGPVFETIVGSVPVDYDGWPPEAVLKFAKGQPVADDIRLRRGVAVFSQNGRRVAYVGKRGGQSIAVIDGKEGQPFTSIDPVRPERAQLFTPGRRVSATGGKSILFSLDGTHVAYAGSNGVGASQRSQVVLDGTAGPEYVSIVDMLFAGQRHVYLASTIDRKYVAVIDGKPMPGAPFDSVNALIGSDDGHFVFYGIRGMTWTVVLDGVEVQAHVRPQEDAQSIVLSPKRGRVAYTAVQGNAPNAPVHLYVDGKLARTAHGFKYLTFSPDGTRFAGTVFQIDGMGGNGSAPRGGRGNPPPGPGRQFAFVDDWNSPDYTNPIAPRLGIAPVGAATLGQSAPLFYFSPDSKHVAFIAQKSYGFEVVVVDGKESAAYSQEIREFQFSPNGRRYAFRVRQDPGELLVVDGKEEPFDGITYASLTFSPDGNRIAYQSGKGVKSIDVIDGVAQADPPSLGFGWRLFRNVPAIGFAFSPNGQRLIRVQSQNPPGFAVDGFRFQTGLARMPTFSADGRHFAFFVESNYKWVLVVDGKSRPIDGDVYEVPGSMRFQSDGTLRFLTMKDDWLRAMTVAFR
jgi:WD40-like Beta Propeller Repeat